MLLNHPHMPALRPHCAGTLQLGLGGPWYCVLPDSEWPEEEEKRAEIRKDFQEPHGDRRCVLLPLVCECACLLQQCRTRMQAGGLLPRNLAGCSGLYSSAPARSIPLPRPTAPLNSGLCP